MDLDDSHALMPYGIVDGHGLAVNINSRIRGKSLREIGEYFYLELTSITSGSNYFTDSDKFQL